MTKKNTHEFIIRVRFDRPCEAASALFEVRDNIHGEFFTANVHPEPEIFRVKSFKPIPKRMR